MTGYGQASSKANGKTINVTIKSLNSKFGDVKIRSGFELGVHEITLRKLAMDTLTRGKVDLLIELSQDEEQHAVGINKQLFKAYFEEITQLATQSGADSTGIIQGILSIPKVLEDTPLLKEDEMPILEKTVKEALGQLMEFRQREGNPLSKELIEYADRILKLLAQISEADVNRLDKTRERVEQKTASLLNSDSFDQNRMEQEILYYLERLDISEEKSRLEEHCKHFKEVVDGDANLKGKKLGFISQEMGREINTMGAKSNDAEIQKMVVDMKDSLEKIKEQVLNVL